MPDNFIKCLKATIGSRTSVTTILKKLTTGNDVFLDSFII